MKPSHRPLFEAFPLPSLPVDEIARRELLGALPPLRPEEASGVVSIAFLAGAGSRWRTSLAAARKEPGAWPAGDVAVNFPDDAPRGLFPVPDFLDGRDGRERIAMAAYAFDAVRDIARHIVVVRGWKEAIDAEALGPAGISSGTRVFFTQKSGPAGQVYGHGDAALQCEPLWKDARYVVTNFAGDANSWLTVELTLRAFARFEALGLSVGALIPVAYTQNPSYPVYLDERGIPVGFWHQKLAGAPMSARPPAPVSPEAATGIEAAVPTDFTNVGVRVYRADYLRAALFELKEKYFGIFTGRMNRNVGDEGEAGWHIPGNDPAKHECALDNVDNLLARKGYVRVMPISLPRELTPLKSLDEYDGFVDAVRGVQRELSAVRRGAC